MSCSYMLSDIGISILEKSPLNNYNLPPIPDLIVYNTNQCLEIKHWLTYYAEKYNVPKKCVKITCGKKSRNKTVEVTGNE